MMMFIINFSGVQVPAEGIFTAHKEMLVEVI